MVNDIKNIQDPDFSIINPLDVIKRSRLLNEKESTIMTNLSEELKEVFDKTQVFRTRTEMEVSVLNDVHFPTPASKYWQAIREQNVMFQELVSLSFEYKKTAIEVKILQNKSKKFASDLEEELIQLEIEQKLVENGFRERVARARVTELKHWSEIKIREAAKMTKDELADVDNHQLISYTRRWIKQSMIMGPSGTPAERQNLLGQLRSGILLSIKLGILDKVLSDFPEEIQKRIKKEYLSTNTG